MMPENPSTIPARASRTAWPWLLWADGKRHAQPLAVLIYAVCAIGAVEYFFLPWRLREWWPQLLLHYPSPLTAQAWWVGGNTLCWVVIPLFIAAALRNRLSQLGLSWGKGRSSLFTIYGPLFLLMAPVIFWASSQPNFQQTYPLLRLAAGDRYSWSILLGFWALYLWQFFTVEFFFRGFILFSLERYIGQLAVAVAVIPYCVIHFHKPWPEALGSIAAGLVLGWLALHTRSIWGGVLLHMGVALSMDWLSLWRTGRLPPIIG
jgi:uncharacterized protein